MTDSNGKSYVLVCYLVPSARKEALLMNNGELQKFDVMKEESVFNLVQLGVHASPQFY